MQKKYISIVRKIAGIFISLTLALGSFSPALAAQVVSAPLSAQANAMNGMVRIYLSSLGNPSSLNLTVVGSYSVNGSQSLSSGQSLTVGFSSSTGALTLTQGGTKTNMGTYFALRRHSATGTNGIKISQARVPGNPYPGDLSFQAVRQSNGTYKLYTIAHIYLENYLYGVLPYEMGNGAHIEALKAQAVAARTYTVNMMATRAGGTYDVVDTTNDQVYNGTPSGNANCVAAVDATKGIVVKNGSAYTGTYYSASNGGQMESAANLWGSSGYGYLMVKDDPFDLANPDSVVKRATVAASCTGGGTNASLLALLKTKAISALNSAGYNATSGNTTLQTVKSITPHTPKYSAPSRLYTKMDFALTASTRNRSGGAVTATVTVTCGIFTELESMLGMSIQSATNELWTVAKSGSNFVLEARRYGHGIGMSQRGAMQMGRMGYTYDQILGFYYNNCKRVRISFTNTILAPGSSQEQTTVEDPADFQESDTGCTGVVKLVGSASSLAIRGEKSLSGAILGVIPNNSPVSVYANDGAWCFIRFGGIKGYVPLNALTLSGSAPADTTEAVTQISGFATVQANGYLNLRASGSSSATVLTTAPTGSILTVFDKSGGWAQVQFGATVAYASTDFLAFSSTYPAGVASSGSMSATVNLDDPSASVNLRSAPSTDSGVLAQLPHGTAVTVLRDDGSWSTVLYNGITGYVVSSYLKGEGEGLEGGSPGQEEPGDPQTPLETATVNTTAGYIRQEADENAPSLLLVGMGQSVAVLEKGDVWSRVRYEGVTGYLLTASLMFQAGGDSGGQETTAVVATQSGSLNLRMEAGAGNPILTTIPKGTQIAVTARGELWSAVRYNGISGYVMTSFLQFPSQDNGGEPSQPGGPAGATTAVVATQSGSLNLRAEGRAGSAILTTIPKGTQITVRQWGAEWSSVTYLGVSGYVMTVFLQFEQTQEPTQPDQEEDPDDPSATPEPEAALYAVVTTVSGSLNLRQDLFLGSPVLAQIPRGTTLQIMKKLGDWSQTTYGGHQGYVMNTYLTFQESAAPEEGNQGDSGTDQPQDAPKSAWVSTSGGTLNLREATSLNGRILAVIPNTTALSVLQYGDTWCQVDHQGVVGYVMTQYLRFPQGQNPADTGGQSGQGENQNQAETAAWVSTASGSLNLRETMSLSAKILTTIPRLAEVAVLGNTGDWCYIRYGTLLGYVVSSFLSATAPNAPQAAEASGEGGGESTDPGVEEVFAEQENNSAPVQVNSDPQAAGQGGGESTDSGVGEVFGQQESNSAPVQTDAPAPEAPQAQETTEIILDDTLKAVSRETFAFLNPQAGKSSTALWAECSERGVPLALMPGEAWVQVLQEGKTWCQVRYENQVGYCLKEYLLIEEAQP